MTMEQAYEGAEAAYDFQAFLSEKRGEKNVYGTVFPSDRSSKLNNSRSVEDIADDYELRSMGNPNSAVHGILIHDGYAVGFSRG